MNTGTVADIAQEARKALEWQRMSLNQCTACGADLGPDCLETRCLAHEEPIALLVEEDRDGTWGLWVGLVGENPITSPYGFCVGTGQTRDEAIERGRVALTSGLRTARGEGRGGVSPRAGVLMPKLTKHPEFFATSDWRIHSNESGGWYHEALTAGASVAAAVQLTAIADTLRTISSRLDLLGVEGLHYLLRHETAKRRKADKAARTKRANARRAAKAAAGVRL